MRTFKLLKSALILMMMGSSLTAETRRLLKKAGSIPATPGTTQNVVNITDGLSIEFPRNQGSTKSFLYHPYSPQFVQETIRLLHVVLREIQPTLMDLDWPEPSLEKRLTACLRLSQYIQLLELHPVFQIRAGSLKPLQEIRERYENDLLADIQLSPDQSLAALKDLLLNRPFEDTYCLHELFSRIQTFIEPIQLQSEADWNWFGQRAAEWLEPDLHHTYQVWLDQNPDFILSQLKAEFRDRYVINVEISLPYVSQTYLAYNRELVQELRLLNENHPDLKRLELAMEFAALRFEPFDQSPEVYEQLAQIYPSFEGANQYFANDPARARLFFPFFDQLKNQADRLMKRGQFACVEAMPMDPNVCIPLWSNAIKLYSFVIEHAPFRILSRQAAESIGQMMETNRSGHEFIPKGEFMKLLDKTEKPFL